MNKPGEIQKLLRVIFWMKTTFRVNKIQKKSLNLPGRQHIHNRMQVSLPVGRQGANAAYGIHALTFHRPKWRHNLKPK